MSDRNRELSERLLRERLQSLHRHLQLVHAGVVVSAAALQHQRAEQDEEIAQVLRYFVGARLFEQIEQTEELIAWLQGGR